MTSCNATGLATLQTASMDVEEGLFTTPYADDLDGEALQ
jgi:hypothetical protein